MSDQEDRLVRCFGSVFPELTAEEIRNANAGSIGLLDSLAMVTLAAVIQEEFNLEIDPADLSSLDSFGAFQAYLRRHGSAGG